MADPYYRDVEASVKNIRPDNVLNRINDIISKNVNEPGVVDPLRWIKSRLQDDLTPGAMQSLSKQIKNMSFEKNVAGKSLYSKGALNSVKKILDDEIGKTEKAFKTAQDVYRKGSRPINQMQVGREMALKLENAMETETPGTFLNAIRNAPRTVQRATGLGVYENLGDILKPGQLRKVDNVAQELLRQKQQAIMERSVRPIFSDIKGGIEPRLPRILERSVVIANHALSKLGVDKSDEYHKLALDMLMNPERLIQVLKQPEQDVSRKLAMQIVDRLSAQIPAQTAARSVGEQ